MAPETCAALGSVTIIRLPMDDACRPPRTLVRTARALLRELRPRQWVKNLVCFAGVVFSGRLFILHDVLSAGIGFLAFCLAASAVYIINDFFDLSNDSCNERTARRPLACGELSVGIALLALLPLLGLSLLLGARLGPGCLVVLTVYLLMNVLYSCRLKQTVLVDVICLAMGFVLRVIFGVYAVREYPSAWIVLCMFFLALFLGFAKRRSELEAAQDSPRRLRPVLLKYRLPFLDSLLTMMATMTMISYALFTVLSHKNPTLIVTIVPVVYCVCRYFLQVMLHGRGESPEEILFSDRLFQAGIFCWLAMCVAILYLDVNLFTETVVFTSR